MKVNLAYGEGLIEVEVPRDGCDVIEPAHLAGLSDEKASVEQALKNPIGCRPLREWITPESRICIVFTDITRATPNNRLIPWLLDYLKEVPKDNITLLNALGTHRPNTRAELAALLTPGVLKDYRVLNHEPENEAELIQFGTTRDGTSALLNRHLATADVRIITGFIEPHFFAGFSGGVKGIMPGVAGLRTVMSNHGAKNIGHPSAAFGITNGNPLWEELRDIALRVGPSFLLNVTLNNRREITGVFAGDLLEAHRAGCQFVQLSAMQRVAHPYDVVITTNSGYPLDQNLYQGVKGMSAGARILKEGGTLIVACECREGAPAGSPFDRLLASASGPDEVLARLMTPGFLHPEQWQVQIQALIQKRARVLLYSSLTDEQTQRAWLVPCRDIGRAVEEALATRPAPSRVAVLPQGPLTIPYLQ